MELISIIVPVYKVEAYLDACLDSIVNQTYRNLEIILVDDGSPDRCPSMCDAWAEKDSRIRVIHQENGGLSAARNAGLDVAKGSYVGFVDSDDMIRADMYEILLNAIQNSSKKMACCYDGWDPDVPYEVGPLDKREMDIEETVRCILKGQTGTSVWRRLFHRSVWDLLRFPVGEINEDYPLLIPTAIAAGGMVHVREKLYFYRKTSDSITATFWKKDANIVLVNLERIYKQISENRLNCMPQFRQFALRAVYQVNIELDKHLPELSETNRNVHEKCLEVMRRLCVSAMFGNGLKTKDKILYGMIVTRALRPVYRILRKL